MYSHHSHTLAIRVALYLIALSEKKIALNDIFNSTLLKQHDCAIT